MLEAFTKANIDKWRNETEPCIEILLGIDDKGKTTYI